MKKSIFIAALLFCGVAVFAEKVSNSSGKAVDRAASWSFMTAICSIFRGKDKKQTPAKPALPDISYKVLFDQNDYRELCETSRALSANAPRFAVMPEREKLLYKVDSLLAKANSERSLDLGKFYQDQVDRIIREVAEYQDDVPRFWKFYSSGFIIKDKARTLAVDINPGCVPGFGKTALLMSDAQVEKLADIIDIYFCTHSHHDHISPELCEALAARKKAMVMPQEAIDRWMIKGATASESFDTPWCKTFLHWQGVDYKKGLDNSMYLFTLSNGKNVFVRGDIYHGSGFDLCLEHIEKWNLKVDYTFLTPYFTTGDNPVLKLNEKYACRFIPVHEWEFSHRRSGVSAKATQDFTELYQAFAVPYAAGRTQFLFWGESIDLD